MENNKTTMYVVSLTTATATLYGTVENHGANIQGMAFGSYADAVEAAEAFAAERGAAYVAPATQAPDLKEGQSYVEVVIG